jgi:exopolyphosphatase/guanosine-5'-triphosphate,3'-diphosphate pyrophosphatase
MDAALSPSSSRRRRKTRARAMAAIDLGTNNCRLLIAVPAPGGCFKVVESFSRAVRLGEGVAQTGLLSEAAIGRAVAALSICAERIGRRPGARLRAIATEACRKARNADALLSRVRKETGIALEIVSADEEARLAAVGCAPLLDPAYEGALVFDIGGGSTELIWLAKGEQTPVYSTSVPIGVVGLAERFGAGGGLDEIRNAVRADFTAAREAMAAVRAFDPATHHLLGTSGTVTTLAALALDLPRYERDKVDASWHDCEGMIAIVERLAALDLEARAKLGCVGPERADLVLAGCAIFSVIHALWPCTRLRVADRGLREGILRELMAQGRT